MNERDNIIDKLYLNGHISESEADLLDSSNVYYYTIISDSIPQFYMTVV